MDLRNTDKHHQAGVIYHLVQTIPAAILAWTEKEQAVPRVSGELGA